MTVYKTRGRSPCGERGLKCRDCEGMRGVRDKSLPVRGAWVEILACFHADIRQHGRSPCGERGLKLAVLAANNVIIVSLPVRGAWVEITEIVTVTDCRRSLPVRGAWVEMLGFWLLHKNPSGRSPCGERGLKSCGV